MNMKQFIIEPPFWNLFPDAEIGVVLAKRIDNTDGLPIQTKQKINAYLEKCNEEAIKFLGAEVFSQNPAVAIWREAFAKFKTKKGARASIENLLKRVAKGNPVGSINPLVDIYNGISLRFGLPCGGDDLDVLQGNMRLTVTNGNDAFLALGDETPDNTLPGEVCYLDDVDSVCRCWNWRGGQRTMLTEKTKNVILIIESADKSRTEDLKKATEELAAHIQTWLGGETKMVMMNKENAQIEL